ncbi:hypothetical protein LEP1GSC168_2572 [Leptospira santarosai str. HAI134]|uniref:Uncharacterized protein n=2 Tax=Leptospira santarosai TaxID=28183 RepID=M6UEH3_9LEPT|nr:hypothetical protein LEP1GSC179_3794 [Leptospira santarosai str. MOR084]EMM85915.1 hypothetical protein LEP1GSC039_1562 [Leptospira santarosai str. 2000027870]EMO14062.1 hypothetical protein LEP1GSC165_2922 [Leptospira santarosai str. CBC523]EMO22073.1 hypothetical protein LEP1GSC168_2572 [Leptospira santarosai str. HAI134]EMO34500.1 hypothetical protein LEP1GSC175_3240 [Leptospira santarosai str. HAI821]EMO43477.1 hypothetical protein LEP1GSC187_2965 [Leptospira santarosai str. ZUN179]EMP
MEGDFFSIRKTGDFSFKDLSQNLRMQRFVIPNLPMELIFLQVFG